MRARNIKPGFFRNEDLVECSFAARLLYAGLWCMADRAGRLENRPKKIKMELFPADDLNMPALLDELHKKGLVLIYGDGDCFIWIPGFLKHQNPHKDEKASILPAHQEDPLYQKGVDTELAPTEHHASTVQTPCKHSSNPADSLILNPDSLILNPDSSDKSELFPGEPKTHAPIEVFREAWNTMAAKHGLPQCREMTGKRKTEFTARWKDPGWRRDYPEAIAKVPESPFLLGKNDRGWKANMEWFLRPDSLTKILEENYGGNRSLSIASPYDSAGLF